jgi:hypothetical protein
MVFNRDKLINITSASNRATYLNETNEIIDRNYFKSIKLPNNFLIDVIYLVGKYINIYKVNEFGEVDLYSGSGGTSDIYEFFDTDIGFEVKKNSNIIYTYIQPDINYKADKDFASPTSNYVIGDLVSSYIDNKTLNVNKTAVSVDKQGDTKIYSLNLIMGDNVKITAIDENNIKLNIDDEIKAREGGDTDTLNEAKEYTDTEVETETTARSNADATLQENINEEQTAREEADTNEATTREEADTQLQENLDNETSIRQSDISTLNENLDYFNQLRATGDINTLASAKTYTDEQIQEVQENSGTYIGQGFDTYADLEAYVIPSNVSKGDFTFVLADETHEGHTTRYICVLEGTTKSFNFAYVLNTNFTQEQWDAINSGISADGIAAINEAINGKQATLISGTNIKTINSTTILGSENIVLQTPLNRTIITNLATTASATDTGGNISGGVSGVLPIANGGTGNTTNQSASCSGNAASATKLQTARTINGTSFDGSANITIPGVPNIVSVSGNVLKISGLEDGYSPAMRYIEIKRFLAGEYNFEPPIKFYFEHSGRNSRRYGNITGDYSIFTISAISGGSFTITDNRSFDYKNVDLWEVDVSRGNGVSVSSP